MDEVEVKLKCLELATSGDPRGTLIRSQEYYEWVTEKPKKAGGRKAPRSNVAGKKGAGA